MNGAPALLSPIARAAWADSAEALATWTLTHLANRVDVWGAFIPLHRRTDPDKKAWTAPAKNRRSLDTLTEAVLARHFIGHSVDDLVGVHSTSADLTSRWLGFDIDNHGGNPERARENAANVARIIAGLRDRGAEPLVERACDRDGFHLWVTLDEPAPTHRVYSFAHTLLTELGLEGACEAFPKQASLAPGKFGNWLRLPGRHHTRDHWSEIRSARRWLRGADAIAKILEHPTTPASILPLAEAPAVSAAVNMGPRIAPQSVPEGSALERRVAHYIAKLPVGLRKGTGRNDVGFRLACFLVRDLSLSDSDALRGLRVWNYSNTDGLSDEKMTSLIADAKAYGDHAYGSGLQERTS